MAVVPLLFVTGCFTAMERSGEAWSGGGTDSARANAAALDVVTFPIQAPILVAGAAGALADSPANKKRAEEAEREAKEYKRLMSLLENDPEIALRERWDLKNPLHRSVFEDSFSNPKVRYTEEILEEIYQSVPGVPGVRDYVYCSKACSKEFLARHFDEECQRSVNVSYVGLANLVSNPNTSLDLVEKIASSKTIPIGAVYPARKALSQRRSEQVSQPTTNTPSVLP